MVVFDSFVLFSRYLHIIQIVLINHLLFHLVTITDVCDKYIGLLFFKIFFVFT